MSLGRLAILAALAACHPSNGSHADAPAGDAASDANTAGCPGAGISTDVASLVLSDTTQLIDVTENMNAPLRLPTQAGEYLLVGARVKTAATQLTATGDLRDPVTHRIIGLDTRTMFMASTGNGWVAPTPHPDWWYAMPNVSACPNSLETQATNGTPLTLELQVYDGSGTQLACLAATVVPDCQGDATCESYCAAH
jgi:hypothetical protein